MYYRQSSNRTFVKTDSGCIVVVNRRLNSDGYYRARTSDGYLEMYHRTIWKQTNGEIPIGFEINHVCRNRACCNLDHLELLDVSYHKTITNLSRDFKIGEWAKEGNKKLIDKDQDI